MEHIRLPHTLPGGLDLHAVNMRLRAGEVVLDWALVAEASEGALRALLAGLDLVQHADALGVDTAPDALAPMIEAALAPVPAQRSRRKQAAAGPSPAVFSAPPDAPAEPAPPVEPPPPPPPPAVLRKLTPVEIRNELETKVLLDLHGPAGGAEEELAEATVRDRYLIGVLAPAGVELPAEQNDDLAASGETDDEDGKPDPDGGGRASLLPSSFGLTFRLDGAASHLRVTARWGRYARQAREEGSGLVWKRQAFEATTPLALADGELGPWAPDPDRPEIQVRGKCRRGAADWVVTLFLVNGQAAPKRGSHGGQDAAWLFQAGLEVEEGRGQALFLGRDTAAQGPVEQSDEQIAAMLYRDVLEFAVGHGVGVHAEVSPDNRRRALRLATRAMPRFELGPTRAPVVDEIPGLGCIPLDMRELADLPAAELQTRLLPLADAYSTWINERRATVAAGGAGLAGHEGAATLALERCAEAERRIRTGIELLDRDSKAAEAFRFMNRAMALQRVRSIYTERVRRGETIEVGDVDIAKNRSWYPFQLAFILLSLPGVTDLHHPDRSSSSSATADLLWFPTGGGKTEAYLGLAAYTMVLRRLQGPIEGRSGEQGIAVLMRYTLRLLTLQQFQRAATLLCACENLRREAAAAGDGRLGETPFRIGLWVGRKVSPNTTEQSYEAVRQVHGTGPFGGSRTGSPHQLVNCPWCATPIDPGRHIEVERMAQGRGRTLLYCGDSLGRCPFSRAQSKGEGLPVLVVDEEIYRLLPSLLVATVDKFAQMPWNGATETLFGQVAGRCERHGFRSPELEDADTHHKTRDGRLPSAKTVPTPQLRPPDLIIQDELHLISGPLGTLVGLYETAVDRLAGWEVNGRWVRPKVIASTATIRRAADQTHALFRRRVAIFPPSGLDYNDSFFARQRPASPDHPGRLYLGVCAQGRRLKATLIRVYVALLSASQSLYQDCGASADPWMTLVGYFNSMRELGGTRRLVDDDISSRLRKMDRRGLAKRYLQPTAIEELTSRKASTDIPALLDRLEVPFDPAQTGGRRPLDVVLATNMVSVGVDVRRLGLMVVCGRPKTTAEYIQATSRVGRQHPGLVVTVYNWARPRDLSHYERFEHDHATFYTQVEALSVTPFSSRALDRGLFAVLASLVRLSGLEFNGNDRASQVRGTHPLVSAAVDAIVERAHAVTQDPAQAQQVRDFLLARLDQWAWEASSADPARPLGYREETNLKKLLRYPSEEAWGEFTCLTSLRDVEPTVPLLLHDMQAVDRVREFQAATVAEPEAEA